MDSKDSPTQLNITRLSVKDLLQEFLAEIKGLKYLKA